MEKLLELYKEDEQQWMEYLYEHMGVFFSGMRVNNLRWDPLDNFHDAYLITDELIRKSIDGDYHPQQIYTYIIRKLRWIFMNKQNETQKEHGKLGYVSWINNPQDMKNYNNNVWKWASSEHKEHMNNVEMEYMKSILHEYINYLPSDDRALMLLRYFGEWNTFKDIAEYLGISDSHIYRRHSLIADRAKKILKSKYSPHEAKRDVKDEDWESAGPERPQTSS